MKDVILQLIGWLNELLTQIGTNAIVSGHLGTYLPTFYASIQAIYNTVTLPVGLTIFSIFLLLELFHTTISHDALSGGNMGSVHLVIKLLVKASVVVVFMNHVIDILELIFNLTADITSSLSSFTAASGVTVQVPAALFAAELTTGFMTNFFNALLLFIAVLITMVAVCAGYIICICRFMEIYLMIAVSPIPMATLPHSEWSQIAKNFLRSFLAACMQGMLIYLVLAFFPLVYNTIDFSNELLGIMSLIGYSVVLVVALFSTSKWAKSICNAM